MDIDQAIYSRDHASVALDCWRRYLGSFNDFGAATFEDSKTLAQWSTWCTATRGETLALPEETSDSVWLIQHGWVWLTRVMEDGRSLAIEVFGPGELVGELAVLTGQPFSETVDCLQEASLIRLPMSPLRRLCETRQGFARALGQRVGERIERIESRVSSFMFTTVLVRITRLLLQLSDRYGKADRLGTLIPVPLTHSEIGQLVGCNREAATRAIDSLLDAGAIAYDAKLIRVLRLEGLCAAAECDLARCKHMCRRTRSI